MTVKLYTKNSCGYCTMAKSLLKSKNIQFEEINIEAGNALGGFRTTLSFGIFKKPRNQRDRIGVGKWNLENR